MDFFTLEKCVGHAQAVVAQKLKQSLAILIDLAPPKASETSGPSLVVSSHSCVKVSKKVNANSAGDPGYRFI